MSTRDRSPLRWWPVIVVAALAALWWWSGRDSRVKQERTYRESVLQVDTAKLTTFDIHPAPLRGFPPMRFTREDGRWKVTSAGYSTPADARPMRELLSLISDLRTDRVLGSMEQVGQRYGLTDSLATILEIPGTPSPTRLRIGATGRADSREAESTAVLREGDPQAYTVYGDLLRLGTMVYPDWIPKPMVNGDPTKWQRLTFLFPGGVGYRMERQGQRWTIDGRELDSAKVSKYLGNLSIYSGSALVDPNDTLDAILTYQLLVEDSTGAPPVALGIFTVGDRLIARSTLAPPHIVMPFSKDVELRRIFRMPQAFMPGGGEPK